MVEKYKFPMIVFSLIVSFIATALIMPELDVSGIVTVFAAVGLWVALFYGACAVSGLILGFIEGMIELKEESQS